MYSDELPRVADVLYFKTAKAGRGEIAPLTGIGIGVAVFDESSGEECFKCAHSGLIIALRDHRGVFAEAADDGEDGGGRAVGVDVMRQCALAVGLFHDVSNDVE